jgi:hypothetical protein
VLLKRVDGKQRQKKNMGARGNTRFISRYFNTRNKSGISAHPCILYLGHSKLNFSFPSGPERPALISNYTRAGGPFPLSIMVSER